MPAERVTVTLPAELLRSVDRLERDRSRFILEAVRREIERRWREELRRSLRTPHPESLGLAEAGLGEWEKALPEEDLAELVDPAGGRPIRWTPDDGWVETAGAR